MGTTREDRFFYSNELLTSAILYKQLEDRIYDLLSGKKINTSLIVEGLGMQRNTAYYKVKTRGFSSEELEKIAKKAIEIYKLV